jgi:hypothetical protein
MKKGIKKLELKKLFKEYGFLKIDEEYKIELLNSYGPEFEESIHSIFKNNPDLDLLFNKGQASSDNRESSIIPNNKLIGVEIYVQNSNYETSNSVELYTGITKSDVSEIFINDDVKKLYRSIATKTHPDKVSNKYLNDLYLKSQVAYNKNDFFTLYLICNDLEIDYEVIPERIVEFKGIIKAMHAKNFRIEQTYLWAWIHEENEEIKSNILKHFISNSYRR